MSICPWCKTNTPRAYDVCPTCGKSPHEHPSISSGGYASFEGFDDYDEPDGGLSLANEVKPLASQDGPDVFGGEVVEGASGPMTLEVDTGPIRPLARSSAASLPAIRPPTTSYRDPTEAAPDQAPAIDPYEIAVLADYGESPEKIWEFPAYAMRVTARKRDLQRRLIMAKRSVDDAERLRDERLASLAEQIRPELEASRELAQILEPLLQVEEMAASRQQALSERNQELDQRVSAVVQEIHARRGEEGAAKGKADEAARKLDHARGELERARASFKRAEIELRNMQQVARAAAGPQARVALPEHAEKIQNLTAILQERQEAVQPPQAAFDAAQRAWNEADRVVKQIQRQISELEKQRRSIEQSYAKELGVRSKGVQQAESDRFLAFVSIGARLIESNAPVVPQASREAFLEAQASLNKKLLEVDRLNQALALADPAAVKKGWLLAGAGVLLVLVLLLLLIVLFGRSEPEPLYGAPPSTPPFPGANSSTSF